MRPTITDWYNRFFIIPTISIVWDNCNIDDNTSSWAISFDWLRWSIELKGYTKNKKRTTMKIKAPIKIEEYGIRIYSTFKWYKRLWVIIKNPFTYIFYGYIEY